MRIDKWIWAVRMAKTRTLAGNLCSSGKVTINEIPAKPSKSCKIGDTITVRQNGVAKIYKITKLIPKRVSAPLAAECFEDLTPEAIKSTKYLHQTYRDVTQKDGRVSKKDKRARMAAKEFSLNELDSQSRNI